jgi:hypothetical protein
MDSSSLAIITRLDTLTLADKQHCLWHFKGMQVSTVGEEQRMPFSTCGGMMADDRRGVFWGLELEYKPEIGNIN